MVSPSFSFNDADIQIGTQSFSDNDFKINLGQLGYVNSIKINDGSSSIISVNLGFGYNRIADFDQSFMGSQNQSSISFLDGIVDYANSEALSNNYLEQDFRQVEFRDWDTKLAWDTYLINPATDNDNQQIDGAYQNILYADEKTDQTKSWERTGEITEYLLSAGLNFNHKFYLGATLGIHDVYFKQESAYSEQISDNSFTYSDYYKLTGTGYVFKVGAIFKPVPSVRLGLAFHTPTYYQLDEENTLSIQSRLLKDHYSEGTNLFRYDFYTPMKTIFSGAFVINKIAIISFDTEYLDYSSMKYRNGSHGDSMSDINSDINNVYDNAFNYRLGGELRLPEGFSVQAGYESYGNPFKNRTTINEETIKNDLTSISFGFGYSMKSFFIDTAYKQYSGKNNIYDQQPNYSDIPLDYTNKKIIMTLGFRF